MLRVIVESANGIPKKKLGNPDPIAGVVFRGETIALTFFLLSGETPVNSIHAHSVSLTIKLSYFLLSLKFWTSLLQLHVAYYQFTVCIYSFILI